MTVFIKGAGDIASGVAWRLHRCGLTVILSDLEKPTAVRRYVSFCQACYDGVTTVEGVTARLCRDEAALAAALARGELPLVIDPGGGWVKRLRPDVVVDAILAKKNLGTRITDAPLVIALGPGFTAGVDCHCVVETMRGHTLGRCLYAGSALADTGVPGSVQGYTTQRVLRAPCAGVFTPLRAIGDEVSAGEVIATVNGAPVKAEISGVLRGLLQGGLSVPAGCKAGDIDPRGDKALCDTISDKALAIGGGVLEAIFHSRRHTHEI